MIDYYLINKSLEHYESDGFERVEVPWLVTSETDNITKPENVEPFVVSSKNKNLIASGEQGFLYNEIKGFLPRGKFVTVTPCFRNDKHDTTHLKTFMKVELYINDFTPENMFGKLDETIESAVSFFNYILTTYNISDKVKVIECDGSFDIMLGDLELGSYGIRQHKYLKWIYGTGLAEPRFSNKIKEIQVKNGIPH